jgi:trigger factor
MKSTTTNISNTRVSLLISVDKDELNAAKQVALKKLVKDLKVAGFRKGRVPIEVAVKHIDAATLDAETLNNAISKSVSDAFLGGDIHVLERPAVDVKKYVPGQELEYTAEADVLPEVTLGDYKKLTAKMDVAKVTTADVAEVLDRIQKSMGAQEEIAEKSAMGDEVVIDFVGTKQGEVFEGGTASDYSLELGSGSFIPGFEEALVGMKAGAQKDIALTFPSDYHAESLAGQKVVFAVTLKKVLRTTLPELNDEFAAKVGPFTSIADLKKDIKAEITAQKKREANDTLKDALVKQLVSKSKVDVPNVLREDQVRSLEQDLIQNLSYKGMTLEQYYEQNGHANREAWAKAEALEMAESRIKAGMVLAKLSKVLGIEATADELAEHVTRYKEQYANDPDMVKRFDAPEVQREVANRLITEKTVDQLVALNGN